MPHTLPGSSSANPSSETFSYSPSEIEFTTRAVTLVLAGRPSNRTAAPISKRATEPYCTSLWVHEDCETRLRERVNRIQTGESHRNLAGNSSTTPDLRFIGCRTHACFRVRHRALDPRETRLLGSECLPFFSPSQIQFNTNKEETSMSETSTLIGYGGRTIGREELALVPTPAATETHRPVPHHEIVQALVETLGFRHIGVVHDEYAVSPDGMKAFGVLDLETEMAGCRFSIGLRNSHDKSMRLAMTCGYRVFVCSNMAFAGDFTRVLAKHSKSFSLIDCISVGVDRMQRNFEPMRKQVEGWQRSELTDVTAKVVIYEAFVEGRLEAPKHLARSVHDLYFEPKYEEFRPRTIWSLSNAFTSALKELDPIPQFRATAKLGEFLEARFSQSF